MNRTTQQQVASQTSPQRARPARRAIAGAPVLGWIIGPVFLLLAGWFVWAAPDANIPVTERIPVDPASIIWPLRAPSTEPPTIEVAGFTKNCSECHSLFQLNPDQPLVLSQHRNIVQGHGMNDRCFNCHDNKDPSQLILPGGDTLPFVESAQLCAMCHGTTYRDWQLGMHGRTTGSWNLHSEAHGKLTCTACHDPHAPAFPSMSELPGPNTLRMGDPDHVKPAHTGRHNPLRQWSRGQHQETPH